jgi:hypothetical protein
MVAFTNDVIDVLAVTHPDFYPVFFFDQSSCHAAMGDAPSATKMNLGIGGVRKGEELKMKPTILLEDTPLLPAGTLQHLVFQKGCDHPLDTKRKMKPEEYEGKVKGARQILKERGLWKDKMTKKGKPGKPETSWLRVLQQQKDFLLAKSMLAEAVEERGGDCILLPKYHCECNPIEYLWGHAKRQVRSHCDFKLESLRTNLALALQTVEKADDERNPGRGGLGVPRSTVQLFWRKAHSYHEVYNTTNATAHTAGQERELLRKKRQSHQKTGTYLAKKPKRVATVKVRTGKGLKLRETETIRSAPTSRLSVERKPQKERKSPEKRPRIWKRRSGSGVQAPITRVTVV